MNKKELQQRGKGLLALMLALIMMFGTSMTIPAGSDYSALLADEDMFYGYFYFANQIGAQIEPVS